MLSEHLDSKERARIAIAHRKSRQQITDSTLTDINKRLAEEHSSLHDRPIGLQMDQSSRASWETDIVPQVDDIPFAMAGQGQQAAIKVALAMSRTSGTSTFILIEEPENHLSHTSLTRLIARIEDLAGDDQQLFVTTHSSFVLNRLGVDKLLLLHGAAPPSWRLSAMTPRVTSANLPATTPCAWSSQAGSRSSKGRPTRSSSSVPTRTRWAGCRPTTASTSSPWTG